ncbi:bacteriochlorophyll 4-vinyl reductase [Caenispirillum salinarum]|uniref:bacteriochlorophyll 4-vinyl reductase n=1 Tax=Caenispirillum salinarum TaxID=859058 RepID=UPI00384B844E
MPRPAIQDHAPDAVLAAAAGVIGPNALIQVAAALKESYGPAEAAAVFAAAGVARYLDTPPRTMVDERMVTALHAALRAHLGVAEARAVADDAGVRTADYLLAHRIPPAAQRVLRVLPPTLAARMLLGSIGAHAWTFAGSGTFTHRAGRPVVLEIKGCPLCRGALAASEEVLCDYYAGTFRHLFLTLVTPRARIAQTTCQAAGAAACGFIIAW